MNIIILLPGHNVHRSTCKHTPQQTQLYLHKIKHKILIPKTPAVGCPSGAGSADEPSFILYFWLSEFHVVSPFGN